MKEKAKELRKTVLEMCIKAGTGHVTSCFSCVEILVALYYGGVLKHDPKNPKWKDRDRFLLSKGQASPLLYAILADRGFFPKEDLETFCQPGGKFGVHLQNDVPGVECTFGSLGNGLGIAAGMALAAKKNRQNHMVYVLLGDAECYEGAIWEAAMFASHNRLNNLVAIIDRNHLGVTDWTESMLALEPLEEKWTSFGWAAGNTSGHNKNILGVFRELEFRRNNIPTVIIANTTKGGGLSFMSNDPKWHGLAPSGEDAERARKELL